MQRTAILACGHSVQVEVPDIGVGGFIAPVSVFCPEHKVFQSTIIATEQESILKPVPASMFTASGVELSKTESQPELEATDTQEPKE